LEDLFKFGLGNLPQVPIPIFEKEATVFASGLH